MSAGGTLQRRTARRLAVVSDFHLGRPGSALACTLGADEIIDAITALRERTDILVVNGDLFDLERGALPFQSRELRLLSSVHHRVVDALTGPEIVWTRGNHDRILERDGLALSALDMELPSGVFRIEHGDRFDALIKRNRTFTTMVTWASGWAHAVRPLRPIYHAMRLAEKVLSGAGTATGEPISARAEQWLEGETYYRGMILGHTHQPILRAGADGRLVMNPGGSMSEVRALVIEAGSAKLLLWNGRGFEELETRAV